MTHFLLNYFTELWSLILEMSPWLLLGVILAGLLKVYFPEQKVRQYLGKSDTKSAVNASLLGIPMPLCSCGVIPVGISFFKNGASKGATNSFLISTPQTGVDSILATYALLGWPFAILRPIVAFITGVAGGILTNLGCRPATSKTHKKSPFSDLKPDYSQLKKSADSNSCSDSNCKCHSKESKSTNKWIKAGNYAFIELLQDIAGWLIIGLAIASLIAVLIPDQFFSSFKNDGFLEMLIILIASVPLYICATGSIPIAAVLILKGISPGAALVFLMAGPATNIATLSVLGKTMGKKSTLIYLATIAGGALLFGELINLFIPQNLFLSQIEAIYSSTGGEIIPQWLALGSTILLILLIIGGFIYQKIPVKEPNNIDDYHQIKVEGMTCMHCEQNVKKQLSQIAGINEVIPNRHKSIVLLKGDNINFDKIATELKTIGFNFKGTIK